ncbi:MAG: hypothetical protein JNL88_00720 [Bacteroidia bacterium]|nr:hypothetical protein [Bacteroidia bacterium]
MTANPGMDERMSRFLHENTTLTLCVSRHEQPHCANCFYAFWEEQALLIIKSDANTVHMRQALLNPRVAGTILPDRLNLQALRGIQYKGSLLPEEEISPGLADTLSERYHHKFPFAREHAGTLWAFRLREIKMTDNTLGFGKKIHWPHP